MRASSISPSRIVRENQFATPRRWEHSCKPPELRDCEIHLWAVETSADLKFFEKDRLLSSAEERTRATRIRSELDRKRFLSSRAQLRKLLHLYTGVSPQNLEFELGKHGKPALKQDAHRKKVCFNVSKSKNWTIFAFALDDRIGIDLEMLPRPADFKRLARRVLTPGERAYLSALPAQQRQNAFLALWTRKEAYGKALGLGLSYTLNQTELLKNSDLPVNRVVLHRIALPFDGICTLATTLATPSIRGFMPLTAGDASVA